MKIRKRFTPDQTLYLWKNEKDTTASIPEALEVSGYQEQIIQPWGEDCIEKITDPRLLVFLPSKKKRTGVSVLVCPGGGYSLVSIVNEGYEIAQWLNAHGIAAFVLLYRLPSDAIMSNKKTGPLKDAQQALAVLSPRLKEWGLLQEKVGVMGFSAGGHLAASLSVQPNGHRPAFSILGYPVISLRSEITHQGTRENLLGMQPSEAEVHQFSCDEAVTKETPPAFLFHSVDDDVVPFQNSLNYFQALKSLGIKTELHLFQSGGHGYGLRPSLISPKQTQGNWPEICLNWLRQNGF